MAEKAEKHVVMTRAVAREWIARIARAEYRLTVLYGASSTLNVQELLHSLRDGRVAMEGVGAVPDMGVRETSFDGVEVWSRDREAMEALRDWFEKRGFETTGIW